MWITWRNVANQNCGEQHRVSMVIAAEDERQGRGPTSSMRQLDIHSQVEMLKVD